MEDQTQKLLGDIVEGARTGLDGCEQLSQGFEGIQSYPALAQRLLERGMNEETIRDIFWNNALNVLRSAER